MPRRAAIVSIHQMKEINMIPLIDVMMFLLIVFIITVPMIEQGIPVNLPVGKGDDISAAHNRAVPLDLQGRVFLDTRPITREALAAEMKLVRNDPHLTVMVRADEGLAYGRIVEVMRILHDAHITRIGLVTSPREKAGR